MGLYFLRRFLLIIPTLLGITLVCFVIINLAPGSPIQQKLAALRFGGAMGGAGMGSLGGERGDQGVTEEVIAALKRQYRWVLVDSPPVAAVTDALLLAQRADSTILVVQQNKVDRAMVKRALAALRKVTPHVIGAVLNAVDVKTKGYYGYAYYGSRKEHQEKSAGRGPAGKRPGQQPTPPAEEVSDASIV